jgi:hypothetical protein
MSIRWLSAVWIESPYRGEHLLLHLALADFANDEGICWPSVRTLAKKSRCSEQWVRKGIRRMMEDEFVEILEQGLGRGNVNRYRLLSMSKKGATEIPDSEKGATENAERGNSEHSPSYIENRHESSNDLDHRFEKFWQAYPRKVGKGKARQAFMRIMARKDAPDLHALLSSIEAYRSSISDPKFIAHPTTWLNGERWLDEIEAASGVGSVSLRRDPSLASAESMGAAFALSGRSLLELQELIDAYSPERKEAAIEAYKQTINRRNGQ